MFDFNPRPREEGDGGKRPAKHSPIISIHALVKRATLNDTTSSGTPADFNPRPREEGDGCVQNLASLYSYFNPRPREEGDLRATVKGAGASLISIHALVKRATENTAVYGKVHRYFNPRPREEGDI